MKSAQKRKHAALIRITARERNDEELPLALAYADRLEAEAELEDALAGVEPTVADHADVELIVPVLGCTSVSGFTTLRSWQASMPIGGSTRSFNGVAFTSGHALNRAL